jgi:hypothetical protein
MSTDMRIGASLRAEPSPAVAPAPQAQVQSDRSVLWALGLALCACGAAYALEVLKPPRSGVRYLAGQLLVYSTSP